MPKFDALMCILFSQIMGYIVDMVLHTQSNIILYLYFQNKAMVSSSCIDCITALVFSFRNLSY